MDTGSSLHESMSIEYLDPAEVTFAVTTGGFLSMCRKNPRECYKRVHLHRAFPLSSQERYISVLTPDGKEIGIIECMSDFGDEVRGMLEKELNTRYFTPAISRIVSIKEEFGYSYWEAETDAGPCRFTVRSGHGNVIHLDSKRVLVVDADGNRFLIPDYPSLTMREAKWVEPLMNH